MFTQAQIRKVVFGSDVKLGQPYGKSAFGLIIPTDAVKIGNGVNQDYVNATIDRHLAGIADKFGGFTVSAGFGGWLNHEGTLIKEDVITVIAFCDAPTLYQASYIRLVARWLKTELYQDCVTAIAYGHAYLIEEAAY